MPVTAEKSTIDPQLAEQINNLIDARLDTELETRINEINAARTPSLSIIATKGTMDMAYPPFILASTASALGWDVNVFFTFYGLSLLKKDLDLQISPLGNPAMPMKMPFGPRWFQSMEWNIPNAVMSNVPGFDAMATSLMKQTITNKGVAPIQELRDLCIEAEVKLYACQMTVDLFGYNADEFIPDIKDWIGAATYLSLAQRADVTLFV